MTERVVSPTELDLRRVTPPGVEVQRVFSPAAVQQGNDDLKPLGEVAFAGRLLKNGSRYQLVGRIGASLELSCSRCLEPFPMPVDIEVDLTYLPHPADSGTPTPDDVELSDDDLTTDYYREEVLDLAHMLREQFYLVMPMRALCREDCRGLCTQCGTNLNTEACRCTAEWHDPRLEGLRALIKRQDR